MRYYTQKLMVEFVGMWELVLHYLKNRALRNELNYFSKTNFSSVPKAYIKALSVGQLHSMRHL
jgi:hypothetical protein